MNACLLLYFLSKLKSEIDVVCGLKERGGMDSGRTHSLPPKIGWQGGAVTAILHNPFKKRRPPTNLFSIYLSS